MRIQMKASFFKLILGKNKPLESPARLGLICFKTFDLTLM